ncbi:MAG TPA: PAS domain S-box protein [Dehalococcoidia bacterium]
MEDSVFRNLFEAAPDGILIVDSNGRVVDANAQVEGLFGYSRSELLGQPIEKLVPERLRSRHSQERVDYQGHPTTRPMGIGLELVGRRSDGSDLPVEISLSPVEAPGGHLTIAIVRDITERQRLTAEREALRIAFETEQERYRIGMDLHDGIMQDVYAVSLSLEMALADLAEEPASTERLLNRAIDELHEVVRDVRNYIFDLRPRRFSGELAQALTDLGREFQENTSIFTDVRAADATVSIPENVAVAVYHIAHEALSNIRKHAHADRVEVSLQANDGAVAVEVKDNGLGFDASTEPAESHRGLRNMIARAKAAGGELEITSTPGEGALVCARFKL